jgi:hypothetical protein
MAHCKEYALLNFIESFCSPTKIVQYELKIRSKFGASKVSVFDQKYFFKDFNKI